MLVIDTLRDALQAVARDVGRMPRLVHIGLLIAVAAFAADVVVHVWPATPHHHHDGFDLSEHAAHLVGLIAMAMVLAGVLVDGIRRQRSHRRRDGASQGGSRHAHR